MNMNIKEILIKACESDSAGLRLEALKLYESGIKELLQVVKNESDSSLKHHYAEKIKEYMTRAECIKNEIQKKSTDVVVEHISIKDGETGYNYQRIFGNYLTKDVKKIDMEEPYLKQKYQIINLIAFLELVVNQCKNLKEIIITTQPDNRPQTEQKKIFGEMTADFRNRNISLKFQYSEVLHDRQIVFSNGYIFKIGRGLDIFKALKVHFTVGYLDFVYRECKETKIDIFKIS